MLDWCRFARDVARKDLLLFRSDLRGAVLVFLVPVALGALFGCIFRNGAKGQIERVRLALVVEDASDLATGVVSALHSHPCLAVVELSPSRAREVVRDNRVALMVTLPEGLGKGAPDQRPRMRHAPGSLYEGNWAAGIVTEAILREAGKGLTPLAGGASLVDMLESRYGIVREAAGTADQDRAVFGHSFCGMTIQYLLFLGMDCGLLLLRERTGGAWKRLASCPVPPSAVIAGRAMATMAIALAQIIFTLGCAWILFGVPVLGSVPGLLLVAPAVAGLAASGGLLVASIGGSEARARSVAILVILAASLLGGLWLPDFLLPGWVRALGLLMPTTWALRGLEAATWQGAGFARAATCALIVAAYGLAFLILATALLARRKADRVSRGNTMNQRAALAVVLVHAWPGGPAFAQDPAARVVGLKPVPVPALRFEDQFERAHRLDGYPGDVLVLIYGDRQSAESNRKLGETLHLSFHPGAGALPPSRAREAPPLPIAGLPAGKRCPDVHAVPVAVVGKVPSLVRTILRGEFRKASPDCPVWLDCDDTMRQAFGMAAGVPNLVVIDSRSRVRMAAGGRLGPGHVQELVDGIEALRLEAAGLR